MSCDCYTIGGPFIAEDPDCPEHGWEAQKERERHEIKLEGLNQRIRFLEAERDALRKDAERYRWIRDTGRLKLGPVIGPRGGKYRAIISGIALGAVSAEIETLDDAIAAIAAKEPNRE